MAAVTIQVVGICAGGDHATVRMTKGAQVREVPMNVADLRGALTQEDMEGFAKVAMKLLADGKTAVQFRNAALAGFTVTL